MMSLERQVRVVAGPRFSPHTAGLLRQSARDRPIRLRSEGLVLQAYGYLRHGNADHPNASNNRCPHPYVMLLETNEDSLDEIFIPPAQ